MSRSPPPGVQRRNPLRVSQGLFHPAGTVKVRAGSNRCDVYVPSPSGPKRTHGGGPSCESRHGPVHVLVSPMTVSGDSVGCPSWPASSSARSNGSGRGPPRRRRPRRRPPASRRPPSSPSVGSPTERRLRIDGGGRHLVGDAESRSRTSVSFMDHLWVVRSASRPRATSERTVAWRQPRSSAIVASGRSS